MSGAADAQAKSSSLSKDELMALLRDEANPDECQSGVVSDAVRCLLLCCVQGACRGCSDLPGGLLQCLRWASSMDLGGGGGAAQHSCTMRCRAAQSCKRRSAPHPWAPPHPPFPLHFL